MTPFEAYKFLCTVAGLHLLSTVSAQSSAQVNLIDNGSFEAYASCANGNSWCIQKTDSLIAPWTVVGGNGEFEIDKIPDWKGADTGSWSMDLSPNGPATIQQVLTKAVPGTSYTINFKLNANRYCGDATKTGWIQVVGANAGKQVFSYNSQATTAWQTVSYVFVAPNGGSTLQVASTHSSSCGPVIDAFTMYPTTSTQVVSQAKAVETSTVLTTSVVDQTTLTTTTITENAYTTTRRLLTVYYDDDLKKVVTAPADISAATATIFTTIYTPVVKYQNKTIIETSTRTPAAFVSTIRDTVTVAVPTVTFTATV